jgi:beta-lactamase regulating signal transducer with metallopeptidase domain
MMPLLFGNTSAAWTDSLLIGLLAFAIRATVLLLAAWLATSLLHHASAATRHLIWTSAIAGVLTLPLLGVLVPAWNVPVMSIAATSDSPLESPTAAPSPSKREAAGIATSSASSASGGSSASSASSATLPTDPRPRASVEAASTTKTIAGRAESLTRQLSVQGMVATAWLLLALLLLSRLAIANARVSSWQRASSAVEDTRWLALLRKLARQYGIERPVVLLENQETDVPVTWGIVYPVILLPAGAEQWDEEQRVAVLTHELAHVQRFDALTQLLAQLALALLWFHPLVWMAVRRMRLEREHACDDFVLVAGARASRYADDLLGLARRLTRPTAPAAAALAMARRSELEGRLLAILDPATKRSTVRRARVGLLTLAVFALATPLAAFRPSARVRIDSKPRATTSGAMTQTNAARDSNAAKSIEDPKPVTTLSDQAHSLESLMQRAGTLSASTLRMQSVPALARLHPDTEPRVQVDLQTLIDVTKAAKRMTADSEKGQLLALIAKRYQRSDALRDAYLDAVFTMTSDHERSRALIALLDRDSLPLSAVAKVLRSTAMMTSDMNKGMVLKRISPDVFADTAVQRAYLDAIVAMTSDLERSSAISSLIKQRPLTPAVQLALLQAIVPMTSNVEKSNALLLFLDRQGIADDNVRRSFFKTAETLSSDGDYRRVMMAVMK